MKPHTLKQDQNIRKDLLEPTNLQPYNNTVFGAESENTLPYFVFKHVEKKIEVNKKIQTLPHNFIIRYNEQIFHSHLPLCDPPLF